MRSGFLPLLCLLVACGGEGEPPAKSGVGGAAGAAGSGGVAGGCAGDAAPPSSGKHTLEVGGSERTYQLHLPSTYDAATPSPLVMNFHGRTPSASGEASLLQELVSKLSAKGESAGFIVVNPQGLVNANDEQTWNAGQCCSDDDTRDDVGFVDALLDHLEGVLCIDPKRVFATGLSNGGYMAHRLACERTDRFAAIAPVAAANRMDSCNPSRSIGVISFNGTADQLVNYDGASESSAQWVSRNGCSPTPEQTFAQGDSRCDTFAGCNEGTSVVFCTIEDGGHTWPGGLDLSGLGLGKTTMDLNASDALWDFFSSHPLP